MIDIVIVNWNSGELINSCIKSIHKHQDKAINKIIVVDNGSTDGSDSSLEDFPLVNLVRAKSNLGFAKACNLFYFSIQILLFIQILLKKF